MADHTGVDEAVSEVTLASLDFRLRKVEALQRRNVPKFLQALRRLLQVETDVSTAIIGVTELKQVIADDKAVRDANAQKLDDIHAILTATKTGWGWARKYGGKALPFVVGIAVAKGWIASENGANFLHIFGL